MLSRWGPQTLLKENPGLHCLRNAIQMKNCNVTPVTSGHVKEEQFLLRQNPQPMTAPLLLLRSIETPLLAAWGFFSIENVAIWIPNKNFWRNSRSTLRHCLGSLHPITIYEFVPLLCDFCTGDAFSCIDVVAILSDCFDTVAWTE